MIHHTSSSLRRHAASPEIAPNMSSGKAYHLQIYTRGAKVFEGDVSSLVVPTEMGLTGILYNHAPMMTLLTPGKLKIETPEGETQHHKVGRGFLEVHNNLATVLTESLEPVAS